MEWVPLTDYENGINLADRPRRLTQEEIVYIVAHVPLAPSADSTAAEVSRQGVVEWMIETLRETYIAPSAIPALIQRIIQQHNKSLVVPGTPVGITAGEAVGATTTQMTLNSVAPWERILIQDKSGNGHLVKIGDWIDQLIAYDPLRVQNFPENRTQYVELLHPVTIATPDKNGVVTWDTITAVTKHLPVGDMVKVITRSGREVTATQSKSLLVWDGFELVQRDGASIKVGDLVPILCEIPDPTIVLKEIDLRKFLSPKEWLYVSNLTSLYNDYKEYEVPGKHGFWSNKSRLDNVPYARGDSALKVCRDSLDTGKLFNYCIYPKIWGGSTNTIIPEKFPLDKQFGQIVGLYLAEGWATDTFVGISNNASEIQDLVYRWCDKYGVTYHTVTTESARGTSNDIKIHSVLFARWFKRWMGTGSANKIMPPEILLGNRDFIIGVLDGYFAGDGTVNQRDGYLSISSASKDLITGFGFLCNRLGIFGKQSGHQPKSNNVGSKNIKYVNTYSIRNKNALIWADVIGSCHEEKQIKMQKIEVTQKGNTQWGIYYQKQKNVMLDPIVSVEFVPATEYVYDLTIPTTTNFSLWNGLGVADTFHTSGSSKSASFGIDAMRDLIFARKTPKNESSTIYFTDKNATYETVLDSRKYIVGSVVKDFIRDHDIDNPQVLERFWWHDTAPLLLRKEVPDSTKVLRLFLNTTEMFKHRVSIADLAAVLEKEVPPSAVAIYGPIGDGIIDLYPHPAIITETLKGKEKGVIPPDLAEVTYLESVVMPELANIRVKGIAGIKQLYPLVSPVWRIVILERKLTERDLATEELTAILGPHLGTAWILFCNPDIMRMTGLKRENLAALCSLAGLTVIGGTPDRIIVKMPYDRFHTDYDDIVYQIEDRMWRKLATETLLRFEDLVFKEVDEEHFTEADDMWTEEIDEKSVVQWPRGHIRKINNKLYKQVDETLLRNIEDSIYEEIVPEHGKMVEIKDMKPSDYVAKKVAADKLAIKKEAQRLTQINVEAAQYLPENEKRALIHKPVTVPRTDLMKAAEFVIAETDGSNLKELLALPGIDKLRTTCNNMYTITATLGIEAARTFLIRALSNTISNTGSYVHPANIMFIAEFITSRGEPYGATYTGISRQPGGHLSLATVERAGKVFTQNALHGRKEDIRNVSASVAVGTRMAIGSGAFDIAQDITENGIRRTIINDDLFTALEKDDTTKELAEYAALQVQTATINADELLQGVEALKALTVGDVTFDYTGNENEADLIKLFGAGEMIPQTGAPRPEQPGAQHKVVRRVQPQPITTGQEPIVPRDLIDTLAQIKVGVPLPETAARVTITPLETGIVTEQIKPIPITSTGLIPLAEIFPAAIGTGVPVGLEALLNQYLTIAGEPVGPLAEEPPVTIIEELPAVDIPDLPDLEGINLGRDMIELRREQVRDLRPVDIDALQNQ